MRAAEGSIAPGFESFAAAFATDPRGGSALTVLRHGEPMVLTGRGLIDLDAPMSAYWPTFRAEASVRNVLAHTAGLPSFPVPRPVPRPASAWADWDLLCADTGMDLFLQSKVTWGLGVRIESDGTWGQGGLGGNAGWADPARGLAIGYVTRRLGDFAAVDRIETAPGNLMSG